MHSLPTRLRWPFLGLLAAAVVAVPTARGQDAKKPDPDKQKKIEEIEKQLADLQKKLAELKGGGSVVPAAAVTTSPVEGTIPDDVLKQFSWRCIGPANMGGRITAIA